MKGTRHGGALHKEDSGMEVFIGKEAPDFKAEAYHRGTAKEIQLSSYRGQWVVVLFYPADFTTV